MRSLRCDGDGDVSIVQIPDPTPRRHEVLVRIEASAVCGSERPELLQGYDGNAGHEASGTIVDPGRSGLREGQRVGLAAIAGCGDCDRCRVGQELHCRQPPKDGRRPAWHAELAAVPQHAIRVLPDDTDPGLGALATGDALGVPVRALRRAPAPPGALVLVIGLGPVGLAHVLVRAFLGCDVVAIEPSRYRRALGRKLGAREVLPVDATLPRRPQLVIESSGRREGIQQALRWVDDGGVVLQSGWCDESISLKPSDLMLEREVTYTGSFYYATEDYQDMLGLLDGGLPLQDMCTHDVPAQDAQDAVSDFLNGESGKVILRWA